MAARWSGDCSVKDLKRFIQQELERLHAPKDRHRFLRRAVAQDVRQWQLQQMQKEAEADEAKAEALHARVAAQRRR